MTDIQDSQCKICRRNNGVDVGKQSAEREREREVEETEWRDQDAQCNGRHHYKANPLPKKNNSLYPHADQLLMIHRFYPNKITSMNTAAQISRTDMKQLVGLTAQLFAKASITPIIFFAENAFDFFLVAVDDILNPLTRKSFDEDNKINF